MRKFWYFICTLFILIPAVATAAVFRTPVTEKGSALLNEKENTKNAYLAGETVISRGKVAEDLIAAGGDVTIEGEVGDNVNAVGGTIEIKSPVGKSVRVAGGKIIISSTVGSDLIIGAGTVTINNNASVKDDLAVTGGKVFLNGSVLGNAYISGGEIFINGTINGDVIIKNSGKVTVGEKTRIEGRLDYAATEEASISNLAVIGGGATYRQIKNNNTWGNNVPVVATSFSMVFFLGTFLLLFLLVYLLPKSVSSFIENGLKKPFEHIGTGFVYLFIAPITALLLFMTLIGIPISLLILGIYLISLVIAKIFIPIVFGSLVYKWLKKEEGYRLDWLTILIGMIVAAILNFVPIFGWLLGFVTLLLLLGTLAQNSFKAIQLQQKNN